MTEEQRIALLGKPRLGETTRCQIRIKESKEFKISALEVKMSTPVQSP
ncbi:unnamed protein product, partial [Cyprideis torosa]